MLSDYIFTTVFAVLSTILIGVDFWILTLSSRGLIGSSSCSTAPLNTFFTGTFISILLCIPALLLVVYESKRNTQSYAFHVFIVFVWVNSFIWGVLGGIWTNQSHNGNYCDSTNSYRSTIVLFSNFAYLFLVQIFITTLALLGIGSIFENTDPITITPMTNTKIRHNGQTISRNLNSRQYNLDQTRNINMEVGLRTQTGINDLVNPDLINTQSHHTTMETMETMETMKTVHENKASIAKPDFSYIYNQNIPSRLKL